MAGFLFIWRRLGFLVPLIAFAFLLVSQLLIDGLFGTGYYAIHRWAPTLALILSALIIGLLGLILNRNVKRIYIDKITSKEVILDRSHSFFFIPFQYWGIIIIGIAILVYLLL
jgi:hypothetical protein